MARAERAGQSLEEYLRAVLLRCAQRPAVADVIARARARVRTAGVLVDAEAILGDQDSDRH